MDIFTTDDTTGKALGIDFMWKSALTAAAANSNTMENMTCIQANATSGKLQFICAVAKSDFATSGTTISIKPTLHLFMGDLKLTNT